MDGEFLRYLLFSIRPTLSQHFRSNTQNNLNAEQVRNLEVTLPPVSEQHHIARYLDQELARIDAVTSKAHESVVLMRERRAALISDAVTGRLDIESYGRGQPEEGVA